MTFFCEFGRSHHFFMQLATFLEMNDFLIPTIAIESLRFILVLNGLSESGESPIKCKITFGQVPQLLAVVFLAFSRERLLNLSEVTFGGV